MAARVRIRDSGGTLRTCTRIRMRDAGNVLRTIQRIRIRDAGGALRTVWQFFTASVSPTGEVKTDSGAAINGTVTSSTFTATPTGGAAAYTYLWSQVSGDPGITITTPTASTTTFSGDVYEGFGLSGVFKCVITDANGAVAESNHVSVTLRWINTT